MCKENRLIVNILMRIYYNTLNSIRNYTPEIWFPLAIVCLNGIVHILNTQFLLSFVEYPDIHRNIQIAISVIGGFSIIVGTLINWLLISVVIFFWCQLFYNAEGVFRNFFEIIGICHLILLVTTLICSIFILTNWPENPTVLESNTTSLKENLEAITETLAPLKFINVIGRICFALILVPVVQFFFQITWLKAFYSVSIPYVVYWILSRSLQSVLFFN